MSRTNMPVAETLGTFDNNSLAKSLYESDICILRPEAGSHLQILFGVPTLDVTRLTYYLLQSF